MIVFPAAYHWASPVAPACRKGDARFRVRGTVSRKHQRLIIERAMHQNRRDFLQASVSATTALLLSSMDVFSTPHKFPFVNTNFELKVLATNWGYTGSTDEFCAAIKKEGYDGL